MPLLCPSRSQNSQRRDPCPRLSPAPRGWAGRSLAACSHGQQGGNKNIRSSPRVCGRGMKGPLQGRSRPVPGREVFIFPLRGSSVRGRVGGGKGKQRDRELVPTAVASSCHLPASYVGKTAPRSCPPLGNPWFGAWGKDLLQGHILPRSPRGGTGCRSGEEGGESRRLELSAGKKSSADAPQPPARAGQGPQPPWLQHGAHRCLPGPGCRRPWGVSPLIVPSRPAGVSCPVPTPSSLEPAGFELPTHIKGHKFGLGLHKFDSINISFRRV